jgi:hypothetical protein
MKKKEEGGRRGRSGGAEERRSGMPEGAEEGKREERKREREGGREGERERERVRGGEGGSRGTGSRGPVSLTEEGRVERRGPDGGPMRIAGGRGRRQEERRVARPPSPLPRLPLRPSSFPRARGTKTNARPKAGARKKGQQVDGV